MNKITRIHTVRHGETLFNARKTYAGSIDVPLSPKGIADASAASRKLVPSEYDVVIVSALRRSEETAALITGKNRGLIRNALCNERDYGRFQGLTEEDVKLAFPETRYAFVGDDYHSLNPPLGESFPELRDRAERFFRSVIKEFEGMNILIVSHGTFLQQFHGIMLGKDWRESLGTSIKNLSCASFVFRGKALLSGQRRDLVKVRQNTW